MESIVPVLVPAGQRSIESSTLPLLLSNLLSDPLTKEKSKKGSIYTGSTNCPFSVLAVALPSPKRPTLSPTHGLRWAVTSADSIRLTGSPRSRRGRSDGRGNSQVPRRANGELCTRCCFPTMTRQICRHHVSATIQPSFPSVHRLTMCCRPRLGERHNLGISTLARVRQLRTIPSERATAPCSPATRDRRVRILRASREPTTWPAH